VDKSELLKFLEPFTDDIEVVLSGPVPDHVIHFSGITYGVDSKGWGIAILHTQLPNDVKRGVT